MKRIRPLLAMALALALICLGGSFAFADDEGGNRSTRGGAASVADPSSMDDWAVILGGETPNTANIGRIWTDKTVSTDTITTSSGSVINRGDSAFITALSALSSTSNVKSSSTTPLDIVLVLDASGSMDDPMNRNDNTKRIDALKKAANDFVTTIAEQNQGISDSSKQHQVSIVKFSGDKSAVVGNDTYTKGGYAYNYSQVMKTMSPCTDAAAFTSTINSIRPAGATRADNGLQLAQSQTSNREDAKKIVIFFTDGSPTSTSGFESGVASEAVSAAKAMKDKGTTVYTIGIFSDANPSADPSGASNENKFMHAVSSNYPEASYTYTQGFWGGWNWDLGTRAEGSDFYKSASNADDLDKVFEGISSEIVKGSGYPTKVTEGAEHQDGFITIDDALGAYMQVDGFKAIALNGQIFENPTQTTAGNVDTYTFDGTVTMDGKDVSLGNVVITVTKSKDPAVGDKVQVKVPAALIPLRSYNVDQKSMTMTISDTKPINVVYTSSLKLGVENLLANPDDTMSKYLQANSQDGKASFYSNDWEQGYLGSTIANFEPSNDNIYYYFTSDTPIYTDEACTQRAHQVVKGNKYWYKYSYYEMTNAGSGAVEEKEKVVRFDGADAEAIEGSIGVNSQGAYFKAGTARLTYLNELYKAKTSNDTGTAIDVLNPKWVGAGQVGSYLGNNGKLSVDLPGTLAVTKRLEVPDGYSANDFANDSFEFTINMPDAATKSFSAVVKNANGDKVGDAFTLTFDGEGKAKHDLKAGETLYVYGLDGGWSYEVSEADRAGFTPAGTDLTGAIVAGQTVNAKVVNTYSASGTLSGGKVLKGEKVLTGRDWLDSDSFDFTITALDGAPMPKRDGSEVSSATVKSPNSKDGDSVSFDFGQIEFTSDMVKDAPGHKRTFTYEVTENAGNLPGIQYSDNKAVVEVTVSDNGQGKLVASATTQNGTFVNRYSSELNYTAAGGLNLAKTLTGRDMTDGQFTIKITPNDEASAGLLGLPEGGREVPMPAAEDGAQVMKSALTGDVVLTQRDAGKTYSYKVVEQGTAPNGYTYDTAQRTVTIAVEGDAAQGTLKATTVVSGGPEGSKTYVYSSDAAGMQERAIVPFNNSYAASGEVDIAAMKSLSGRSLTDGEFNFALKYDNGNEDVATATNDANGKVDFGTIEYTTAGLAKLVTDGHAVKTVKDGKPAWNISYVAYEKTDNLPGGVSAQTQPISFTVTVVDNGNGTLVATANTGNNGLVFKNAYSTGDPIEVGLSGVKILKAGEGLTPASIEGKFTFTVTSDDRYAPMPASTSVKNDANGNVDFGSIAFSLDDLNKALGATNTRATDTDNSAASKADDQGSQGAEGQNGAADSDAAGQADSEQGSAVDSGNGAEGQGAVMAADDGQGKSSAKTVANDADAAGDGSDQAQGNEPSTRAGVSRSHIFTYKVTESGSADGVINDTQATKTVSFEVTDDGNGKLTVERLGAASDPAFAFTNTYSVQPTDSSVTDQVKVTKQLTGRDMAAGEFAFELLEGDKVVATGTNSADGSVALSPITYTKPGTHSYMLREVGGGTHKAGVEYDGSVFAVTTTVTDNGDGTLSVAHKVDNDANAVGFTNSYAPAATSVTLGASKVLNGKSLEDGEFSFALEGEDGTRLTAGNDANGMVVFPAIQYSETGTYQYTLSEVKGSETGVTYDEAAYAVTVAVEDDGEGSLVATVSYEGGKAPVFNNTYQEPEGPAAADDPVSFVKAAVSGAAKTGDNLLGIAGAITAVAAVAAAVAVLSRRKKGKHAKK